MSDRKFTVGERVYYNEEVWRIVWVSGDGRMVDLAHEVTGHLEKMVHTTDLNF